MYLFLLEIGVFKLSVTMEGNTDERKRISTRVRSVDRRRRGTHSSTLAWKIPWTEEPGGLQSMGSLRVGHD